MDISTAWEEQEWRFLETLLPDDLEATARSTGAMKRPREVTSAKALLRLILAYGVSNLSLKDVAAWARAAKIAMLSAPGLFYRFSHATNWLELILGQLLQPLLPSLQSGWTLRVVDATVINGPGATGTDWRVHVKADPQGLIQSVEVTDHHGGESYTRFPFVKGEIILGDRAYSMAPGIQAVSESGAYVVARTNLHSIRLCDEQRQVVDFRKFFTKIPAVGGIEFKILIPVPPSRKGRSHKTWHLKDAVAWIPARLVVGRTRDEGVIWILTTLPSERASPEEIMRMYRLRWQIELLFKRLKSLLHLDALPAKKMEGSTKGTGMTWILARFVVAALIQRLVPPNGPLSPYGYEIQQVGLYR